MIVYYFLPTELDLTRITSQKYFLFEISNVCMRYFSAKTTLLKSMSGNNVKNKYWALLAVHRRVAFIVF